MVYLKSNEERAILATLHYSDIFSFPLTKQELWHLLISKEAITKTAFEQTLTALLAKKAISYQANYFCLSGKEQVIHKRQQALAEVSRKKAIALHVAQKLAKHSSVLFIGISGGLAVGDVTAEDDIDFFVIVKRNTLYSTRLLLLMQLQHMGYRRLPRQRHAADKICLNLLIDETALLWPENQRDVYTAREIAQIDPLIERNTMYRRFLQSNQWITAFVPNALTQQEKELSRKTNHSTKIPLILEKLMRFIQISYMKRNHTTEIITNHFLAFHPTDYRMKIMQDFRQKMRELGLLTNL